MNDEARMSNDETMTKSENRNTSADESFWYNHAESTVREEPEKPRVYDLEERTARFGEAIIDFSKTIPQNPITNRLISQLIGASTSVGANYAEADDSVSKKDFLKSIGTCRKEARETKTFPANGCSGGARAKTASARAVDGSQGTAFDLLKNLERSKE
jgi:23S rRNA-intervening sequence protein